ncbi:cation diffusion facilitator family transporter [Peterkaempfera griseoplana]|uniref:cation diffusion facilitator family transporter n=1 Tax=Peterkaempfera griseoplana TaxID=66896 RepID=UPI0006E20D94|nr:cation diffusion facilitator family transporter [Peterkaempfera griseoplana]
MGKSRRYAGVAESGRGGGESRATVLVAAAANLGVAAAKAVGGIVSGSSAMLSEAAHSVADTVTEVMLLTALTRSSRTPDEEHPLGYSSERYVWALLASVATFFGGAVFSVYDGVQALIHGGQTVDPLVSYVVLGCAFVMEAVSLVRGLRQVQGEAARLERPVGRHLRRTPDTTVKAVVVEDSAALIGIGLAAGGLVADQVTGQGVWDGIASLLIGVLLTCVAWNLGRSNASLLIGRSVSHQMRVEVRAELLALPHIEDVLELVTLIRGPDDVLIAAKIDLRDRSSAGEIEEGCTEAERVLRGRFPAIRHVYLDPTPGGPDPLPEPA